MSYSSANFLDSIPEESSNSQCKSDVVKDALHVSDYGSLSYSSTLEQQFENGQNANFMSGDGSININDEIQHPTPSDRCDQNLELDQQITAENYSTVMNMLQELDVGVLDQQQCGAKKTAVNKISGRARTMQLINEYMTEHESVFQVLSSPVKTNNNNAISDAPVGTMLLFGVPKFELDTKAIQRRSFNRKKPTLFQHMAALHNKFGFRHFMLIGLLALYSVAGGVMFQAIEADNELHNLRTNRKMLEKTIIGLSKEVADFLNVTITFEIQEEIVHIIRKNYVEMLRIEGRYVGSVFHKYEKIAVSLSWYFGNAVFYAMTLFTTIGYGTIACQTSLGKILSIFYAMIGIPLMLVVLSDVGQILLKWFTHVYELSKRKYRVIVIKFTHILCQNYGKGTDYKAKSSLENGSSLKETTSEDDDDEVSDFPLILSITIVLFYLLFVSFIVSFLDFHDGVTPGLSFGDAFYFSFISLTTVGLGDVMPNNIEYSPILALLFLVGLALLSVVNSTVYMRVESKFLSIVDHLEEYLERVHYYRHGNEGYFVFKMLGPNIQVSLLALTLPIFSEQAEDEMQWRDLNNHGPNRRNFPSPKLSRKNTTRNRSTTETFMPCLGIVHPLSRTSTFNDHAGHEINEGRRRTRAQTLSGSYDNNSKRGRTASASVFSTADEQQPYYNLNFLSLSPKLSRHLAMAARRKGKSESHYEETNIEQKPRRIYLRRAGKISPMAGEAIKRVYSDRIPSAIEEVSSNQEQKCSEN